MGNPVVHFEIWGGNAAALQKFYRDAFGWKTQVHEASGYTMVDTESDGAGIGGGIMTPPSGDTGVTIYIDVDDLQAALDKAEKHGAKTIVPPMDVPEGPSIAMFSDPEGNMVGLVTGMA